MMKSSRDDTSDRANGPALEIAHLDVSRGRVQVLHDLTLTVPRGAVVGAPRDGDAVLVQTVPRGAVVGLLGPSGCGKTTLMRTVVGVQRHDSGRVQVLGLPAGDKRLRGHIGYVTQQAAVYTDLSVQANVAYFAALQGAPRGATEQAIESVGLGGLSSRSVSTLSGGQAGRVSLACALVGDPELLVLDEPTVGLDPITREDLWHRFRSLAAAGHTLLVSSHVMDEAWHCDLLALMRDGRLLGLWTPEEFLARTGADTPDRAFLALVRGETAAPGAAAGTRPGTRPGTPPDTAAATPPGTRPAAAPDTPPATPPRPDLPTDLCHPTDLRHPTDEEDAR